MFEPHSLYITGKGTFYSLHPLTKLSGVLAVALLVFLGPGETEKIILIGLLIFLTAVWAGLLLPSIKTTIKLLLPLLIVLVVVQGFFYPQNTTILFSLGKYEYAWEGFLYALFVTARIGVILLASLLFLFSTKLSDFSRALTISGLSSGLVYLIVSPIYMLPDFADRIHRIRESQQSRGLDIEGNFLVRIKALFPLVAPLILGALVETESRALILETRAFNAIGKRSSLVEIYLSRRERVLQILLLTVALILSVIGIIERALFL
ncbi:MAG: hypothetical protein CVU40_15690 [Chloroflexi bacterium HGW-Chloroflexi-2]|jgi:energy-coupling factor transport system permease protein|nr:MAG: hypothetical protein CVU40_15690 [Chloroflexi bacterium HGW-Chloroflexi-2]